MSATLADRKILHELITMVTRAVEARGGDMNYLHHAIRDPSVFRNVMDALVPDSVSLSQLRANEYILRGPVEFPDSARMIRDLDIAGENDREDRLYDDDDAEWLEHPLCNGRLFFHPESNSRIMCIKHVKPGVKSLQDVLDQITDPDYLPATHEEAYAFGMAYPELWMSVGWIAIGSFTRFPHDDQDMCFLNMYPSSGRPAAGMCDIQDMLDFVNDGNAILCVRKST